MSRAIVLLLILLAAIGGLLWFLGNQAEEVPQTTIETDVSAPANAS